MNRATFLRVLAALPLFAWVAPRPRTISIHWWSLGPKGTAEPSHELPAGPAGLDAAWRRLEATVPHPDDDPHGYERMVRVKTAGAVDPWSTDHMDDCSTGELTSRWFHDPGPYRSWVVCSRCGGSGEIHQFQVGETMVPSLREAIATVEDGGIVFVSPSIPCPVCQPSPPELYGRPPAEEFAELQREINREIAAKLAALPRELL